MSNHYYRASYTIKGETTSVEFSTKEEVEHYVFGLQFMDVGSIIKEFYNPLMRSWHRYSSTKQHHGIHE